VAELPQMNGPPPDCWVQEQPAGQEPEKQKRRNIAQVPLLSPTLPVSQQMPLPTAFVEQLPLQHWLAVCSVQGSPFGVQQVVAQLPPHTSCPDGHSHWHVEQL